MFATFLTFFGVELGYYLGYNTKNPPQTTLRGISVEHRGFDNRCYICNHPVKYP